MFPLEGLSTRQGSHILLPGGAPLCRRSDEPASVPRASRRAAAISAHPGHPRAPCVCVGGGEGEVSKVRGERQGRMRGRSRHQQGLWHIQGIHALPVCGGGRGGGEQGATGERQGRMRGRSRHQQGLWHIQGTHAHPVCGGGCMYVGMLCVMWSVDDQGQRGARHGEQGATTHACKQTTTGSEMPSTRKL